MKVENKHSFSEKKMGCIENIKERRRVLKKDDYGQHILVSTVLCLMLVLFLF